MESKFAERFENCENVLLLYQFSKKTIKWLRKNLYNEKLELIFCQYGEKIVKMDDGKLKKNVLAISFCLSLMVGFDEIMLNEFFPKEKKCQELSNLNITIRKHYLI